MMEGRFSLHSSYSVIALFSQFCCLNARPCRLGIRPCNLPTKWELLAKFLGKKHKCLGARGGIITF